ncbi:monocyte to macrophage differentiation factor 2 isoform X5 [Tachypleus tridentatus]|uniref:monocyte to macrophage differentiation factor 2 isoform X5 n=1 Tax=Tachypleus tridentatus TaxID=6853 RepID=UPI003FD28875
MSSASEIPVEDVGEMKGSPNSYVVTKRRFMNAPAKRNEAYVPTEIEHVANIVTHGLWVFPSILGLFFLVYQSSSSPEYISAIIYGLSLIGLFSVSTVFHSVFYSGRFRVLKDILHRCDRAVIYLFIAASYTPWLMLKDLEPEAWSSELCWFVWVMAICGIAYQNLFHERYKTLETCFYLIMGIIPAAATLHMQDRSGLTELAAGGLIYILGVVFFKADGRIPCAHAIWHLFVNVGASLHFYAVFQYLIGKHDKS